MLCSVAGLVHNTRHAFSTLREDPELDEMMEFLDSLKNFEKAGVPKGAGTDSEDGFDLGRMRRLMELLGNPQSRFKTVHIAGTKGKGSTAAFLSSILRAEGYSVGCYTRFLLLLRSAYLLKKILKLQLWRLDWVEHEMPLMLFRVLILLYQS